jgi:hypothetical protein
MIRQFVFGVAHCTLRVTVPVALVDAGSVTATAGVGASETQAESFLDSFRIL